MAFKIFYAWQSDRPNNLCRGLIRRALEDAAKGLKAASDIQDAERDRIEIDSDTQDIPGSPPVAATIFEKIRKSDVFVADLTPIDLIVPEDDDAEGRQQPPPNPNVMLEYGYALDALGDQRLIGVFNKAFGKPDDLPFDLRHRRWPIQYRADASDDADQRRQAGQNLAKALASAIRPIIQDTARPADPMQQLCDRAVALIKKGTDAFIAAVEHRGVDPVEIQRLRDALIMCVVLVLDPARPGELPTTEFMNKVAVSNPQYTGWPVWLDSRDFGREEHRAYVLDGVWQALIVNLDKGSSQHFEFLRFDPLGEFYLRRVMQDDLSHKVAPGVAMDVMLMIYRVAEVLAVGLSMAQNLGWPPGATANFAFRWTGLNDRRLSSWANPLSSVSGFGRESHSYAADAFVQVPLEIPHSALAPHVAVAVGPLFASFDGYAPSQELIETCIRNMIERKMDS